MFELRLVCPESAVEPISDALQALDALSVSAEDADADTQAEQALFGEPGLPPPAPGWSRTTVVALFTQEGAAREAAALLAAQDFFAGSQVQSVAPVPEQDWVRLTQSQFDPVAITPEFWIVPSWHEVPAAATRVIRLDPGLAFGTGTHPTTRMCLRWLAAHPPTGQRVLDYGCGSGILAIGAALHGARAVDAVDIDPAAVQSTQANAAANGVSIDSGLPDAAHGLYDTVLANILATPLKVLAPLLCAHVAAGGALVLAGILERQTEELQQAYRPWLALQVADTQDGWVLMTATRAR
ncbi:MAG: 50S ribosomal protein L11 methyltransferase [Proteobacteria bacterium]|uniref:50S ribosomal protein L11 methyltransferase n=1 Tax=Ottowia sp. TaxID=1898956 RepID=UPI001D555BF3|nr:50S ribosomal protein L11 methyltransferase [Ottowia sp.]MBS0402421.1 50S ribosomal protein L11 methyltransferase [Pseudomonadota bacterium]